MFDLILKEFTKGNKVTLYFISGKSLACEKLVDTIPELQLMLVVKEGTSFAYEYWLDISKVTHFELRKTS